MVKTKWYDPAYLTLKGFMYIANCPFNERKILSKATKGLEKSFWMLYSNIGLISRETVPLNCIACPSIDYLLVLAQTMLSTGSIRQPNNPRWFFGAHLDPSWTWGCQIPKSLSVAAEEDKRARCPTVPTQLVQKPIYQTFGPSHNQPPNCRHA